MSLDELDKLLGNAVVRFWSCKSCIDSGERPTVTWIKDIVICDLCGNSNLHSRIATLEAEVVRLREFAQSVFCRCSECYLKTLDRKCEQCKEAFELFYRPSPDTTTTETTTNTTREE